MAPEAGNKKGRDPKLGCYTRHACCASLLRKATWEAQAEVHPTPSQPAAIYGSARHVHMARTLPPDGRMHQIFRYENGIFLGFYAALAGLAGCHHMLN